MVYTVAGWMTGVFVIPKLTSLVDFLNSAEGFIKLTNVELTTTGERCEFIALQRKAITMIVPSVSESAVHSSIRRRVESAEVSCILEDAVVEGTLEILEGTRVSDFLTQNPSFFSLHDATIRTQLQMENPLHSPPAVVINGRRAIAIAHPGSEPSRPRRPRTR